MHGVLRAMRKPTKTLCAVVINVDSNIAVRGHSRTNYKKHTALRKGGNLAFISGVTDGDIKAFGNN